MNDSNEARMTVKKRWTAWTVMACAAVMAGCSPSTTGRMVAEAPPNEWEDRILLTRQEKDRSFREDPSSPLLPEDRESFEGLDYWPPDPSLRLVGPIHLHDAPQRFTIATTSGRPRPCENHGWLSFVYEGQVFILQIYKMLDNPDVTGTEALFLPFTDGTTGGDTYPAGRYVDLEQLADGRYVLDFNKAMNPFCAYGDPGRYVCPVTPPANRLAVRIEAGERGYKRAETQR